MWQHCCGWSGPASELKPFIYEGILAGLTCPKCGGDWPFFNDDLDYSESHDKIEPERCSHCDGSGKRWIDYREGKKAELVCRNCGGNGYVPD
jgi:DnaJ-class molecular chaperone